MAQFIVMPKLGLTMTEGKIASGTRKKETRLKKGTCSLVLKRISLPMMPKQQGEEF